MRDDGKLLREYAECRSEEAFAELVGRHINMVYFAALRLVGGDAHLADDVAQRVFSDLARKASSLNDRAVLAGWLYTATRYAASQTVRSERRRRIHEEEAHAMQTYAERRNCDWEQLRPVIDEAMNKLSERDREVLLLRFFEDHPLAEVGAKLSLSPDAARMRVDRALDKLRRVLARKGIASTSSALAAVFVSQAGVAAPSGLVAKVVSGVVGNIGSAAPAALWGVWQILVGGSFATLAIGFAVYLAKPFVSSPKPPIAEQQSSVVGAANRVSLPVPATETALRMSASQSPPPNVAKKTRRTTDDFGWPRQGLFAGDSNEKSRHTFAEFHAKMKEDADFRETVIEQARENLDLFYGHLFSSLQLKEPQLTKLKDLLIAKEQLRIDTSEAQNALGYSINEHRDLLRNGLDHGQQGVDAEIKDLLGVDDYTQYLRYREDLVQWTAVNGLARRLQSTSSPLSEEQAQKLATLLRGSLARLRFPFSYDIGYGAGLYSPHIGSGLNKRVFLEAGEFLSGPQLDALRTLQRRQETEQQIISDRSK